ncbi:MAG: hypothetical protein ABIK86_00405 [candidate division WOR-3 bacterium]
MRWFGRQKKDSNHQPESPRPDNPQPESQKAPTKDRVVRVFVSSTFRDMVEDRNELMALVWPALRKLCRARAVEFVEVDLRWRNLGGNLGDALLDFSWSGPCQTCLNNCPKAGLCV